MEAGRLRLRPILMTAFAFIFGVLPLMFATGAGAASRQSLGTTVFGGMVAATTLTLVFVPVFYALIERAREGRRAKAASPQTSPIPRRTSFPAATCCPARKRRNESRSPPMRVLTATLASLAALGAATVAGVEISSHVLGEAKASAPAAAMMAMPVPVAAVVKKTLPIYLDFPGRTESIRSIALQARASGYVESQPAPDGADVKSGDLLYQIDPRDLQAALDQAQAQVAAGRRVARIRQGQFRPRRGAGEERLRRQGRLRPARERDASGRSGAGARSGRGRSGAAQSRLRRNPRPVRRPARPQSGGERGAGRAGVRAAQHPRPARSDLRLVQPQRIRTGGNRQGARRRQGRGRDFAGRPARRRAQGRADLSRQFHRQIDRHDLGARDDRQSRLRPAARANMSACGCTSRTSRTP